MGWCLGVLVEKVGSEKLLMVVKGEKSRMEHGGYFLKEGIQ